MATATDSDPISEGDDDLFEFFFCTAVATPELFAADDVIIGGKLLPSWAPPPPQPKIARSHVPNLSAEFALRRTSSLGINNIPSFSESDHCRSSSLGDRPCGGFPGGKKSREYGKLKRVSDPEPRRPKQQAKLRPRWHALVFAPVRINPSGMETKDIRFRRQQQRRSADPLGQQEAAAENPSELGPWKLLRWLSCRGIEAGNIAA